MPELSQLGNKLSLYSGILNVSNASDGGSVCIAIAISY